MEEELGIPGHAGHSSWSRRLQSWLRDCGLHFEAEGEATRISLGGGVLLEIAESLEGEGYEVVASIPLAGTGREAVETGLPALVARALDVIARVAGDRQLNYDLDTSLPSYPILRVRAAFTDPWEMAEAIAEALSDECGRSQG